MPLRVYNNIGIMHIYLNQSERWSTSMNRYLTMSSLNFDLFNVFVLSIFFFFSYATVYFPYIFFVESLMYVLCSHSRIHVCNNMIYFDRL